MLQSLKSQIKNLPSSPGVYLFKDSMARILYIGKAMDLKKRILSHFGKNTADIFKEYLLPQIADIDFIKTDTVREALILENQLIKKYQPRFNIQWRDDKSYFWVEISKDEWPRVKITHEKRLAINNKQTAIGPFVNGTELKNTLRALRKILPFRTCKNPYEKPCLQWHLGLCPTHLRQGYGGQTYKNPPQPPFIKGGGAVFFQKTAQGDLKKKQKTYLDSLNALAQILRLSAGQPLRLEAYDVSNIQGAWATGSMVVFQGSKPKKSDYRRFRIKTVVGANDVAMLREIIKRRLKHREWPYPNLILIDGGKTQLNAAVSTFKLFTISHRPLAILALAKRENELYTEYSHRGLKLKGLPLFLRLFFQALRDEAHRFAIAYYRKLHAKQFRKTSTKN